MAFALNAQRYFAYASAAICLCWAALAGATILGLWMAVWAIGLSCTAVGAYLYEIRLRQAPERLDLEVGRRAREVMISGFAYLAIGMTAVWFPTVVGVILMTGALADFVAGHHLACLLYTSPSPRDA